LEVEKGKRIELRNMTKKTNSLIPVERVENVIFLLRSQKVIIDSDLAALYGVPTKWLNEQVRRNKERLTPDFMFQLTKKEKEQVVANCDHLQNMKFSPNLPYAFTEHGSVMAASVLNSESAVAVSVYVVRAFIKLRQMLAPYKELTKKLEQLEKKLQAHDKQIVTLDQAIRLLMPPPDAKPKKPFGFYSKKGKEKKSDAKKKKI